MGWLNTSLHVLSIHRSPFHIPELPGLFPDSVLPHFQPFMLPQFLSFWLRAKDKWGLGSRDYDAYYFQTQSAASSSSGAAILANSPFLFPCKGSGFHGRRRSPSFFFSRQQLVDNLGM
jgi:hypothetical protein